MDVSSSLKRPISRPYRVEPNDQLTKDFPCFSFLEADLASPFPSFIAQTITAPVSSLHNPSSEAPISRIVALFGKSDSRFSIPEESPFVPC